MGYWDDKQIISTDGDPGKNIYVGVVDPATLGYDLQIGDVWIRLPVRVYVTPVSTSSTVPAVTVTVA